MIPVHLTVAAADVTKQGSLTALFSFATIQGYEAIVKPKGD
jgi:hypothetical protein